MEIKQNNRNERIVGIIKHLKGSELDAYIRQEKGFKKTDNVTQVVKENSSSRRIDYVKSHGRISNFIKHFKGSKTYENN